MALTGWGRRERGLERPPTADRALGEGSIRLARRSRAIWGALVGWSVRWR